MNKKKEVVKIGKRVEICFIKIPCEGKKELAFAGLAEKFKSYANFLYPLQGVTICTSLFKSETTENVAAELRKALNDLSAKTKEFYVFSEIEGPDQEMLKKIIAFQLEIESIYNVPGGTKVSLDCRIAEPLLKYFLPRDHKTGEFINLAQQTICLKGDVNTFGYSGANIKNIAYCC